jgi:hypothetical protein
VEYVWTLEILTSLMLQETDASSATSPTASTALQMESAKIAQTTSSSTLPITSVSSVT